MANLPTFDYETEASDIERKRKIYEAMQGSALEPLRTEAVGGMAVPHSWTQGLAKAMQAYVASKGQDQVKTDRGALTQRYGDDLRSGMTAFGETSATDKKKAVYDALASNHPVLREFAMKQLTEMGKDQLTPKDLLGISTPESVLAATHDPKQWKPKRELKGVTAGEVLVDAGGNVAQPGAAPGGGQGWETVTIDGDLYQKTATGLKKLDNAAKVSLSNVGNTVVKGQNAGIEAWSKGAADTVKELADSARQSVKLKSQLNQLEALTTGGTPAGPMADAAVFLAGLAKQAGMPVDAAKLGNAHAFNSVATQAWAALMAQNGGARGLVKEESEKLANSLPSLLQSPQGRQQIIATMRQVADQNIADAKMANAQYSKALQTGNLEEFTYGLSSTIEPQSPATPAAPGSVAPGQPNWLPPGFKILGVKE